MSAENQSAYIVLVSIHGLIRGHDLELGRDADTGGQTKYVVDLARALGESPGVRQVDLITRLIRDPAVSEDYAQRVEALNDRARIVRLAAGPDDYIAKEALWDHLDSFTDNLVEHLRDQEQAPSAIHSHYADAGYVGVRVANLLGVPLIHTGHSLGRDKRKRLLANGMSSGAIEQTYNMSRRIRAEEELLANADLVITSTRNEIEQQYRLYDYYEPERMTVIAPGTDLQQFRPPEDNEDPTFLAAIAPFLRDLNKPLVLALSRPDERKNIAILLDAFACSEALRKRANLLIVAGNREDISALDDGAEAVLTDLLLRLDLHNLYGLVALPKQHRAEDVPEIYRTAAASGGVFVNPALTEPFGLTLLEAAASGLPLVATENGGPVDIIANCDNGALVDPLDEKAIASALLKLLDNKKYHARAVRNGLAGVREHYSWQAHAEQYLALVQTLRGEHRRAQLQRPLPDSPAYRDRGIFSDLDQSLLGNPASLPELAAFLRGHERRIMFGIVTGRTLSSALSVMSRHSLPRPDVLITGLGTRIHYGASLAEDRAWRDHIDQDWNRPKIERLLRDEPGLELQPRNCQSDFKLSYYLDTARARSVDQLRSTLHQHELTANLILSFGQYLDTVPSRASKGQALRWAALRLDIPLQRILVAGGSGADEDLLRGNTLAVVVANRHEEELSELVDLDQVFFSETSHAGGILEAVEHYNFLPRDKPEAAS